MAPVRRGDAAVTGEKVRQQCTHPVGIAFEFVDGSLVRAALAFQQLLDRCWKLLIRSVRLHSEFQAVSQGLLMSVGFLIRMVGPFGMPSPSPLAMR